MNLNKRISIITVNFNNCDGLEKTIRSVIDQKSKEFEYIIIDGGSTDGSKEVIEKYLGHIDYWVSEKDRGVYHAMNKGIMKAATDYCYFLNSGDCLWKDDVIEKIVTESKEDPDIIYGNMVHGGINTVERGAAQLTFYRFFVGSIYHQAAFIKRILFEQIGLYKEELKVVADWEFFLKAIFIHNCTTKYVNLEVAIYETGGLSFQDISGNLIDRKRVLEMYFPRFVPDYQELRNYKESDYRGVFRFLEKNKVTSGMLSMMLNFSRTIRFKVFRQKRKVRSV